MSVKTRGRPKNSANKIQEITYNNFQKLQDIKLDGYNIRISVPNQPTRYFFECWLKARIGCHSIAQLDDGSIVFPNNDTTLTREILQDLLQLIPSAKLVKEPKTKLWTLHL